MPSLNSTDVGYLIRGGDLSGNIVGDWIDTGRAERGAVHIAVLTGDAAGTFYFYEAAEITENPDAMSIPTVLKGAGSALNASIPFNFYARYFRCGYVRSGGGAAQTVAVTLSLKPKQ